MIMNVSSSPKFKFLDVVIGFFGWLVLSNLAFLATAELDFENQSVIIWLLVIVSSFFLYYKNRVWISTGILAEFIINAGIWLFIVPPHAIDRILVFAGFPLPLGIIVMILQ